MSRLPRHDFEVVKGNTLHFSLRYAPGGVLMDWTGATVEIAVTKKGGTQLIVDSSRLVLVAPEDVASSTDFNLSSYLDPSETAALDESYNSPYEIRVTDSLGVKRTILFGLIQAVFSSLENG